MTKSNTSLHRARTAKDDEFYTQLTDIEREMLHYKKQFKGKVVFCNCDDPEESNFWKFFKLKFVDYGLKGLVSTHYNPNGSAYVMRIDATGKQTKTALKGDGDFRSDESVAILEESDIVASNPPFSLFREYIAQLVTHGKKFLVVGNYNAVTYKEIFPLIKGNELWVGVSPRSMDFVRPDGATTSVNACWFTNMPNIKRKTEQFLFCTYSKAAYPTYDNYDAIEVNRVSSIPKDYAGCMGVPITFLEKFNPDQFEILGCSYSYGEPIGYHKEGKDFGVSVGKVNVYKRIFIRNRAI